MPNQTHLDTVSDTGTRDRSSCRRAARWILLFLALVPSLARAQDAPRIFAGLEGVWEGEGTLFGGPARFDMQWQLVHGVAVLTFANGVVGQGEQVTPVLGAVAIYRTTTATPRATWEDTRGVQVTITWTATDSELVSTWRAPTESGRTTYTIGPDGTVEVVDEVMQPGGLVLFGQATYRRVR